MRPDHVRLKQRSAVAKRMDKIATKKRFQAASNSTESTSFGIVPGIRKRHRIRLGVVVTIQAPNVLALTVLAWINAIVKMNMNIRRPARLRAFHSHISPDISVCPRA